jgi:hypothetical protein
LLLLEQPFLGLSTLLSLMHLVLGGSQPLALASQPDMLRSQGRFCFSASGILMGLHPTGVRGV